MSRLSGALHLRQQRRKNRWQIRLRDACFIQDRASRGLGLLLAVTFIYLLAEFAFSAWLIDAMASNADPNTLQRIDQWGRFLSGVSLALLAWPLVFLYGRGWRQTLLCLTVVSLGLGCMAYSGERALMRYLIKYSSPESRAAAVTGVQLRQGMAVDAVDTLVFQDVWNEGLAASVSGRAFAPIAAFLISPYRHRDIRPAGLDAEYQRYVLSQREMHQRYLLYRDPQEVQRQARQQWDAYLAELATLNPAWGTIRVTRGGSDAVPAAAAAQVRQRLRERGLMLSDQWRTGDREGFVHAAEAQLSRGLHGMPANLSLGEFVAHPRTQRLWRAALNYPESVPPLSLTPIGSTTFSSRYYRPLMDARQALPPRDYGHQPGAYADGAERAAQGKRAYGIMMTPVVSLTLSLLGILLHLFRGSFLLTQALTGWRIRHPGAELTVLVMSVMLVCLLAQALLPAAVTAQPMYQQWAQSGGAIMGLIDAMVRLQSAAYPLFELVRYVIRLPV